MIVIEGKGTGATPVVAHNLSVSRPSSRLLLKKFFQKKLKKLLTNQTKYDIINIEIKERGN